MQFSSAATRGPKSIRSEGADFPYRVMVERIHEGAVTVDEDQLILYTNPRFAAMVGAAEGTLGGTRFSRFVPEGEAAFFTGLIGAARKSGHSSGNLDLLTSGGERLPVRLSLATLEIVDGQTLCILATDLREQRRMEQAVRRRDMEIRTLLDNTPDVIMRQDAGFRYTYVNAATANVAGVASEDFIGKTSEDLRLPQNLIDLWTEQKLRTIETRQLTTAEYSYPSPDGLIELEQRIIPEFAADGSVESLLIIARDVTERKRLEKVAASSHREVQALAANLLTAQEEERKRVSRRDSTIRFVRIWRLWRSKLASMRSTRRFGGTLYGGSRRCRPAWSRWRKRSGTLSYGLHPSFLDDLGVVASIRKLCREVSAQAGVAVEFTDGEMPRSIPRELAACLYRVAQQSLKNAARHANASQISVMLGIRKGTVVLAIKDDGGGFDREAVRGAGGLGLVGMAERARLAKGKMTITTQPGRGTRILLELPLSRGH